MKTTLDIADDLLRRAKQAALERNTTLRAIVEEALVRSLGPTLPADVALRVVTWPPADTATPGSQRRRSADAIAAALAAERADPADDAARLSRRLAGTAPRRRRS